MLNYQQLVGGTFTLPAGGWQFDVATDGRLAVVGPGSVWIENAAGSRTFTQHAVAAIKADTSLARISPDGARLAAGVYGDSSGGTPVREVLVLAFPSLAVQASFSIASFDAEWIDADTLLISGEGTDGVGPPSVVWYLHVPTSTQQLLINEIDGASAGVTIDNEMNVYTANGFGATAADTGSIKAFTESAWRTAAATSQPLDFHKSGITVADLLSAAPLGFDEQGNLYVGGGDFVGGSGDRGYVAVVSRDTLRRALHGGNVVTASFPPRRLQKLDPDVANLNNFYTVNHNFVRRELYVKDLQQATVIPYYQFLIQNISTVNVHLGDNPSVFPGTTFVGMVYETLLHLPGPGTFTDDMCLRLETEHVETLGGAQHRVRLNGVDVGAISDTGPVEQERFDFFVDQATLQTIIQSGNPATLRIDVDGSVGIGLADDFVIRSLGTVVST